jgi:glycosyltransferase involved in cell wall biosynthesis
MASRQNIAIDVTPLLYVSNGIGRCTRALVDELLKEDRGFDFTLFGRRLGGGKLRDQKFNARHVHLRLPRFAERFIQRTGLLEMNCGADLYHATDFYSPLQRPNRAIATIHDVIFLKSPEPIVDHARLARWVTPFARACRAIITCSQWCRDEISQTLQIDPARIHVTYWGVDQTVFKPEPDEVALRRRLQMSFGIGRPYFLAVSCSTGRKNTPRLLRAFEMLIDRGIEHDWVLVWTAPPEVEQAHRKSIAAGRIRFTGRVSDEALRDLYAGATAAVYPSLNEGFGLPIVEAMCCGTPVITSNTTCLPEIAGGAALLVNPESETDIADAMQTLANQPATCERFKRLGLVRAAEFSWKRCAEQTLDVYRKTLEVA